MYELVLYYSTLWPAKSLKPKPEKCEIIRVSFCHHLIQPIFRHKLGDELFVNGISASHHLFCQRLNGFLHVNHCLPASGLWPSSLGRLQGRKWRMKRLYRRDTAGWIWTVLWLRVGKGVYSFAFPSALRSCAQLYRCGSAESIISVCAYLSLCFCLAW